MSSEMSEHTFSLKIVPSHPMVRSEPPSNTWFLGSPDSVSRTASRWGQPFMHSSRHTVHILYNGPLSQKIMPIPMHGDLHLHLTHWPSFQQPRALSCYIGLQAVGLPQCWYLTNTNRNNKRTHTRTYDQIICDKYLHTPSLLITNLIIFFLFPDKNRTRIFPVCNPACYHPATQPPLKNVYECISEGLTHVAALYHWTPGPKFTKFGQ